MKGNLLRASLEQSVYWQMSVHKILDSVWCWKKLLVETSLVFNVWDNVSYWTMLCAELWLEIASSIMKPSVCTHTCSQWPPHWCANLLLLEVCSNKEHIFSCWNFILVRQSIQRTIWVVLSYCFSSQAQIQTFSHETLFLSIWSWFCTRTLSLSSVPSSTTPAMKMRGFMLGPCNLQIGVPWLG